MSSREAILSAVRAATKNLDREAAPPSAPASPVRYDDPIEQFRAVLESVGGRLERVADDRAAAARLAEQPEFLDATKIAVPDPSLFSGEPPSAAIDLAAVADPHDLADVDYAIVRGRFAVAENAAVWCDQADFGPHRVLTFLAQHAAIVVPASEIVHNLHEAYARLDFSGAGYGVFVSGPSKTADIEQSLVIGAHGARSLLVVLVG